MRAAGVERDNIYDDLASGGRDDRPGLTACLKSLRDGDVLVVWKLDRLGRSLAHLVNTVKELSDRKIGLRVLTGKGAQIDTTTASGRMVFGIFATLAEFERDLIRERTMAGLASARARGRKGGRNSRSPKLRCVSRKPPWPSAILQFPISARNSASSASLSTDMSVPKASSETMESMFSDLRSNSFLFAG
ncbi:recombinase family protein [Pseudomonas soli]|uniref:recombinase family protein n=1 Tax=Pseudomonas soli TaxID=1306993 RepID=UPI003CFD7C63